MAWLARSIIAAGKPSPPDIPEGEESSSRTPLDPSEVPQGRGVKDDLSEIKDTLARQLRGVASFLAPPPPEKAPEDEGIDREGEEVGKIEGIRSDFKEIGGRMKAGISKFLQIRPDEEEKEQIVDEDAIGVTEEVLMFVKDVAVHPRTWVSFPLPEDSDADEFSMNDWQQAHAAEVERRVPELADLRWELCPEHMSESRFWMVYFVLVHPKLDKYDALTLSTPKIVEARAMLTQESKSRRKVKQPEVASSVLSVTQAAPLPLLESSIRDVPISTSATESTPQTAETNLENKHHSDPSHENHYADEPGSRDAAPVGDPKPCTTVSELPSKVQKEDDEKEDGDDWLNEEALEIAAGGTIREIPINTDDDVSFSDLEEDDDTDAAKRLK